MVKYRRTVNKIHSKLKIDQTPKLTDLLDLQIDQIKIRFRLNDANIPSVIKQSVIIHFHKSLILSPIFQVQHLTVGSEARLWLNSSASDMTFLKLNNLKLTNDGMHITLISIEQSSNRKMKPHSQVGLRYVRKFSSL